MAYPESVQYLYSLGNELKVGAKFGLERITVLLSALKDPQSSFRSIHIAGTNGKGSTACLIASALRAAGVRTGLYTSPHLVSPTERIQINGTVISEEEFDDAFQTVHRIAERLVSDGSIDAHPSYFEMVTAMAFHHFRSRVDVAVIEVGLGGRFDATNVVRPELTVITPIDYDHETFLGNTIEAIAGEKAGILKSGIPSVFGRQKSAAEQVLSTRAQELGCAVTRLVDHEPEQVKSTAHGSLFYFQDREFSCPLAGRHQVDNAITAYLACRRWGILNDDISKGFASAQWPGRLEYVSFAPDLVLDGAHNPAGASMLANYIKEFCRDRPVWLVYGAMRDKAIDEVVDVLFPLADKVVLTAVNMPRALRPAAIQEMICHRDVALRATVGEAIAEARKAPPNAIVFITGSLFIVGEARGLLVPSEGRSFVQ